MLLYSRSEVRKWLQDCRSGQLMKHYPVGDFTVYQGRIRRGQIENKWAFFDDRLCIFHQIKDRPYQVANAELFDDVVSRIDGECILSQVPD